MLMVTINSPVTCMLAASQFLGQTGFHVWWLYFDVFDLYSSVRVCVCVCTFIKYVLRLNVVYHCMYNNIIVSMCYA